MATTKLRRGKRNHAQSNGKPSTNSDRVVDPTDPARLTAEERLEEIVTILGKGVMRTRDKCRRGARSINQAATRRRSAPNPPIPAGIADFSPESRQSGLEVPGETSPDGRPG